MDPIDFPTTPANGDEYTVNGKTWVYDAAIPAWLPKPVPFASQAEMEAGTEAALRSMSPLRVKQAVAALADAEVNTANVTAAGALMDSEVENLAAVKAFDPSDYATAAQGTDARMPTAAGLTDKFSTEKTTGNLVDADRVAILDSAATNAPKHGLLSSVWAYIKGKVEGTALTFGQHLVATAQGTGTGDNSLMTRALGDARYARVIVGVAETDQDVTNSSTLTNSTQCAITIPEAGLYFVETSEQVVSSDWANAGTKSALAYTGTVSSGGFAGGSSTRAAASFLNGSFVWNNNWTHTQVIFHPSNSMWVQRQGYLRFTTAGSITIAFAQYTAISGQYARLQARSFLRATRVSS